jgi:hypothetical protein
LIKKTAIYRLKIVLFGLIAFALTLLSISTVQASEVGYTVKVIDNQFQKEDKKGVGYFDLAVPQAQTTDLQIKIVNTSDEVATFNVNVTNATTTSNLDIDYTPTNKRSTALKFVLTDLLKAEQNSFSVEPKTTQPVTFHLTMPKAALEGTVFGGIHVIKNLTDEAKNQGFASQTAYVKPVKLVQSEQPEVTAPEFSFDGCEIKTINYAKRVVATVTNKNSVYLTGVNMTSEITKKDEPKALLTQSKENGSIAPSSTFDLLIDYDSKVLKAGRYTYHITFKSGEKSWTIERNFEIPVIDTDFTFMGRKVVFSWRSIITIILGIVLLVGLLVFVIKRKQADNPKKVRPKKGGKNAGKHQRN